VECPIRFGLDEMQHVRLLPVERPRTKKEKHGRPVVEMHPFPQRQQNFGLWVHFAIVGRVQTIGGGVGQR
jgi:hypothetical protein